MSPRPAPNRHDPSAARFLDAAAQLIDAMFVQDRADRPARLRAIDFPAALQWLRVDDVIRLASESGAPGISRKAFHNRWGTKDEFLRDAVVYTMLYQDHPESDPAAFAGDLSAVKTAPPSASWAVARLSDTVLDTLLSHPRSFLLMHIGPLLDQHPDLHSAVLGSMNSSRAAWHQGYAELLRGFGLQLRPGWSLESVGLALQAILDGFVMRSRIEPNSMRRFRWAEASLFANTVLAFCVGIIDTDHSGLSTAGILDKATTIPPSPTQLSVTTCNLMACPRGGRFGAAGVAQVGACLGTWVTWMWRRLWLGVFLGGCRLSWLRGWWRLAIEFITRRVARCIGSGPRRGRCWWFMGCCGSTCRRPRDVR